MNRAEKTFQARGEEVAKRPEEKARQVRSILAQVPDWTAIERAVQIIAECDDGVGAHSLRTLIECAALADAEREQKNAVKA